MWHGPPFTGAKIALLHGRQIVTYLRDDKPTIPFPGQWDLPGGGRENGETPTECALRELDEEFGIVLDPATLLDIAYHPAGNPGDAGGYFLVARVTAAEIATIRFGSEGQRWELMPLDAFLGHPDVIAYMKIRLRAYLDRAARKTSAPPGAEAPLTDPAARARSAGTGGPPSQGFASLVPELGVGNLAVSLRFWCDLLGFRVAYDRPAARFAYLEHGSLQVMLRELNGRWDTGALNHPFGRGLNLQMFVDDLDPLVTSLHGAKWPLFEWPTVAWYRVGARERGQRECLVQDPDGYLLRFAQDLGLREPASPG